MEMECARDCCKVPIRVYIRVNSPLSYTWHVDSYIFVLFSYSIRFILVREILGRTEKCSYYFRTFKNDFVHLTFKTKKNGHEFLTFYIRSRSSVDSGQWDWGIRNNH